MAHQQWVCQLMDITLVMQMGSTYIFHAFEKKTQKKLYSAMCCKKKTKCA